MAFACIRLARRVSLEGSRTASAYSACGDQSEAHLVADTSGDEMTANADTSHAAGGARSTSGYFDRLSSLLRDVPDVSERTYWLGFVLIGALGIVLRFWDLGGVALWMDEAVTAGFARLPADVILFGKIDNHPPLSYLVQHFWMAVSADPSLVRAPVAVVGSLSVLVMMLAGRDLVSRAAGLTFGLLFALSTGQIYYSQDLRMYPYLVFGLAIAAWGGIGMSRAAHPFGQTRYLALYVLGGTVAIYSHVLGLVAMAVIGGSSLVASLMTPQRLSQARTWLLTNIALFVIVLPWLLFLPSAMGSYPGLPEINPLDFHWHLRAAVGYPGLSALELVQLALELALYGIVVIGAIAAWQTDRALSLIIVGLAIVYPLIVTGLHLISPIMHVRVHLPAGIGVVLGAGLGALALPSAFLRWTALGGLALVSFASSVNELRHHNKLEDYRSGFMYADHKGYRDAPVLSCYDFSASAMWEERPAASILLVYPEGVMKFPGARYWRVVEKSIVTYRTTTAQQKNDYLGGGLLIEGGLADALRSADRAIFMEAACLGDLREELPQMMAGLGFVVEERVRIRGRASREVMLEAPGTNITLFRRTAPATIGRASAE